MNKFVSEELRERVRQMTLLEPVTVKMDGRTALQVAEEMLPVMHHKLQALGPGYVVEMSINEAADAITFQCVGKP